VLNSDFIPWILDVGLLSMPVPRQFNIATFCSFWGGRNAGLVSLPATELVAMKK
jgi:hypothetical protein